MLVKQGRWQGDDAVCVCARAVGNDCGDVHKACGHYSCMCVSPISYHQSCGWRACAFVCMGGGGAPTNPYLPGQWSPQSAHRHRSAQTACVCVCASPHPQPLTSRCGMGTSRGRAVSWDPRNYTSGKTQTHNPRLTQRHTSLVWLLQRHGPVTLHCDVHKANINSCCIGVFRSLRIRTCHNNWS